MLISTQLNSTCDDVLDAGVTYLPIIAGAISALCILKIGHLFIKSVKQRREARINSNLQMRKLSQIKYDPNFQPAVPRSRHLVSPKAPRFYPVPIEASRMDEPAMV